MTQEKTKRLAKLRGIFPRKLSGVREANTTMLADLVVEQAHLEIAIEAFVAPRKERLGQIEGELRRLNAEAALLALAALLRSVVDDRRLSVPHAEISALRTRTRRTDITVADAQAARQALASKTSAFQQVCSHPMVLVQDGNNGSYTMDYSDSVRGVHACLVCGLSKTDDDCEGANTTLGASESRVVRRLANDVTYHHSTSFDARVKEYLALATVAEVVDMFFGEKRMERLTALLAPAKIDG